MLYLWCILTFWVMTANTQDTNPCTTEDKPDARFFFKSSKNVKLTCAEFVNGRHCLCTMDAVRDACCASCEPHKQKLSDCKCQDLLTKDNIIEAINKEDNSTFDVIDNCATLANKYGPWCESHKGNGNLCCQSCKWQDERCADDNSRFRSSLRENILCPEFIAIDRCHCANKLYRKTCCHSCQFIDTSDCHCTDRVTAVDGVDILKRKDTVHPIDNVTSCDVLTKKYPQACKQDSVSGLVGFCCMSCQSVDTSCQDLVNRKLPIFLKHGRNKMATIKSCKQLKKDYPELCAIYGGKEGGCCKACRNVDTSCLDTRLTTWKIGNVAHNCASYIQLDPCRCDGMDGEKCCETCKMIRAKSQNIAHCCNDDPDYRMQDPRCPDCTCAQLVTQKSLFFAKKACNRNISNARHHCCRTCRTAGVFVPAR